MQSAPAMQGPRKIAFPRHITAFSQHAQCLFIFFHDRDCYQLLNKPEKESYKVTNCDKSVFSGKHYGIKSVVNGFLIRSVYLENKAQRNFLITRFQITVIAKADAAEKSNLDIDILFSRLFESPLEDGISAETQSHPLSLRLHFIVIDLPLDWQDIRRDILWYPWSQMLCIILEPVWSKVEFVCAPVSGVCIKLKQTKRAWFLA